MSLESRIFAIEQHLNLTKKQLVTNQDPSGWSDLVVMLGIICCFGMHEWLFEGAKFKNVVMAVFGTCACVLTFCGFAEILFSLGIQF